MCCGSSNNNVGCPSSLLLSPTEASARMCFHYCRSPQHTHKVPHLYITPTFCFYTYVIIPLFKGFLSSNFYSIISTISLSDIKEEKSAVKQVYTEFSPHVAGWCSLWSTHMSVSHCSTPFHIITGEDSSAELWSDKWEGVLESVGCGGGATPTNSAHGEDGRSETTADTGWTDGCSTEWITR